MLSSLIRTLRRRAPTFIPIVSRHIAPALEVCLQNHRQARPNVLHVLRVRHLRPARIRHVKAIAHPIVVRRVHDRLIDIQPQVRQRRGDHSQRPGLIRRVSNVDHRVIRLRRRIDLDRHRRSRILLRVSRRRHRAPTHHRAFHRRARARRPPARASRRRVASQRRRRARDHHNARRECARSSRGSVAFARGSRSIARIVARAIASCVRGRARACARVVVCARARSSATPR